MLPVSRTLFMLFLAAIATTSARAQRKEIECLAPLDSLCTLRQRPGDAKLQLSVRILTQSGNPAAEVPVSFTTSRCCVEPANDSTSPTGIASVIWSGSVPNSVSDRIRIDLWRGGAATPDSIIIRPNPDIPAALALVPVDTYFVWFRDDQVPKPVDFFVERAGNNERITKGECDRAQVIFTPHLGGTAGPSPAYARWFPRDTTREPQPSDTDGTCRVGATWRLANSVGTQHLNARLAGTEGPTRVDANARATARHPPRFVAGFGYFPFEDEEEGESEDGEAQVRATFGLDFPVFSERVCPLHLCRTLRLVIGSTFDDPREEYYASVPLLPLFGGSREALPVQMNLGWANAKGPFVSTTVDASGLLGTAIGRLLQ